MKKLLQRCVREEEGQDLIEYAFLVVFLALVVLAILGSAGTSVSSIFVTINSAVSGAS